MNMSCSPSVQLVVPLVSVVIITRNRPQMLADCLTHLRQQTYTDFEIVVVDSSSNDETADLMQAWPAATYVRISGGRNNMPQARNVGIAHAQGDVVAFIDDDCMVLPEWLACLVSSYEDSQVGGVGGSIMDDRAYVDSSETRTGAILRNGTIIRNFSVDIGTPCDVEWLPGGNMSFTKRALEVSGGFDTGYTGDNSYEEIDHAVRVRKAGYRLRFVPTARLIHLSAPRNPDVATRDFESPQRRFYQTRNGMYFYLKNVGASWEFLRCFAFQQMRGLIAYAVRHPSRSAWERCAATLVGYPAGCLAWLRYCMAGTLRT